MTLVESLWPYVRWPVFAGYTWWGLVWAAVAVYYLRASLKLQRIVTPEYKGSALRLWFTSVVRVASMALNLRDNKVTLAQQQMNVGVGLQHGIVCSALACAFTGVLVGLGDRSHFGVVPLVALVFFVALSTVGGMIHLYAPLHKRHMGLWRAMMLVSWLGTAVMYAGALALWSYYT